MEALVVWLSFVDGAGDGDSAGASSPDRGSHTGPLDTAIFSCLDLTALRNRSPKRTRMSLRNPTDVVAIPLGGS